MNTKLLYGTITVIVVLLVLFTTIFKSDYQKHTWDGGVCEEYYADCSCYGFLSTLESYPEQYGCAGIDWCSDMNQTICQ